MHAPTDRSAALDGVRGIAALAVVVFHGWLYTRTPVVAGARSSWLDYVVHELRLGLVLFFVLSGFLLWRPFVAAARRRRPRPAVGTYLLRRAARIMPAYYLALIGSVILLWGASGTPGVRLPEVELLPLFAVFGQNFNRGTIMKLDPPMWTLAVEVCFYLSLPLVAVVAVRLSARRAVQLAVPAALLLLGVGWNHLIAGWGSIIAGKALPAMLPYFALGMATAVVLDGRKPVGPRGARSLVAVGAALVLADAIWQAHGAATGSGSHVYRIWRDLPAAVGFALIVAVAAGGTGTATAVLRFRPVVALGTISYGLYLWHVPFLLVARHFGFLPLETVAATAVALAMTVPVAAASWRWVEQPMIARARALTSRPRRADRRRQTAVPLIARE